MNYGKEENQIFFYAFGSKCYALNNDKDNLEKFNSKSDEVITMGYSTASKTFCVFSKWNLEVEESVTIVFDEFNNLSRNIRIEENIENLEISQESQETHGDTGEKEIQQK